MKKFCVIGLGNFGFNVATTLAEEGHEVLAIDRNTKKVQRVQDHVDCAIVGDAANKDVLEAQGIGDMDAVVVSTGDNQHQATMITHYLKELNVPRIIVKVTGEDHGEVIETLGATDVVIPERDMARRLAQNISRPSILDYFSMDEGRSVTEVSAPEHFIGKTLVDLDLRRKYGVNVFGIKEAATDSLRLPPSRNYVIQEGDILLLIGKEDAVKELLD